MNRDAAGSRRPSDLRARGSSARTAPLTGRGRASGAWLLALALVAGSGTRATLAAEDPPSGPVAPAGDPPPPAPPVADAPPAQPPAPGAAADPVLEATRRARAGDLDGALTLIAGPAGDPANVDAQILFVDLALRKPGPDARFEAIRKRAAERPDDPVAQHVAARTLAPKSALQEFQRQVLKFPQSPWPFLGRARALAQTGKLTEALRDYDQAVALAGDAVRFRTARALALEAAGRWPDALLDWKLVATARPDDPAALLGVGEAMRRLDDAEGALAQFQAAAKLEPGDPEPLFRIALTHLGTDKHDEAIAACEQALALQPRAYDVLCVAATAALRKASAAAAAARRPLTAKDVAPAVAYADRAIAVDGDRPGAHMERGIAHETAAGTAAEAAAAAEAPAPAIPGPDGAPPSGDPPAAPPGGGPPAEPAPPSGGPPSGGPPSGGPPSGGPPDSADKPPADTPEALLELALADYSNAVARTPMPGPGLVRALLARAHVLFRLERYDESASDALRAADVAPNDEAAWSVAGEALTVGDKAEDAVKRAWKPGLKALPDSGRLHHGYGVTLWKLGRLADGLKELKDAVKFAPANGRFRLTYGEALYQASKEKDALPELLEATGLRGDDREAWACLGHAHVALHRWQEAADAYEQVCAIDPKAVDEHIYLAIIYGDRLKMKDKAKEHAQTWTARGGADPLLASWVDALVNGK